MQVKRITHLGPLVPLFWGVTLLLGAALALVIWGWPDETPLDDDRMPPALCTRAMPCLALVIDDTGRDLPLLERLLRLRVPLTFAVLPHGAQTPESVRAIGQRGQGEMLVHLPMKPDDIRHVTDEALVLGMDGPPETVLAECLGRVPGAVGVNNHMGSELSRDARAMGSIMPILRRQGFFVLDSRTTRGSVICSEAAVHGVPCLSRDLFVDVKDEPEAMAGQLRRATELASRRGWAIAIGHLRGSTVRSLERFLARPRIRMVRLSTLYERVQPRGRSRRPSGVVHSGSWASGSEAGRLEPRRTGSRLPGPWHEAAGPIGSGCSAGS